MANSSKLVLDGFEGPQNTIAHLFEDICKEIGDSGEKVSLLSEFLCGHSMINY